MYTRPSCLDEAHVRMAQEQQAASRKGKTGGARRGALGLCFFTRLGRLALSPLGWHNWNQINCTTGSPCQLHKVKRETNTQLLPWLLKQSSGVFVFDLGGCCKPGALG